MPLFLLGVVVMVDERLSDGRRRGVKNFSASIFPARCPLSELLLFQELQTFVSVVASARLYRGIPVWY